MTEYGGKMSEYAQILELQERLGATQDAMDEIYHTLRELVEVADLRGDSDLPAPADDPKLWTARMTEAWGDANKVLLKFMCKQCYGTGHPTDIRGGAITGLQCYTCEGSGHRP